MVLNEVGSAQRDADIAYEKKIERAKKDFWEYNDFSNRMEIRYNDATRIVHQQKGREKEILEKQANLKRFVNDMESKRAMKRVELQRTEYEYRKNHPKPLSIVQTNFDDLEKGVNKSEKKNKVEKDNFSASYFHMESLDWKPAKQERVVHINSHVIKHVTDNPDNNAMKAAQREKERTRDRMKQQNRLSEARQKRAQQRSQEANSKELVQNNFDQFTSELEQLKQFEIKKRLHLIKNRKPSVGAIAEKQTKENYLNKVEKVFEKQLKNVRRQPPPSKHLQVVYESRMHYPQTDIQDQEPNDEMNTSK
jgi:hypothetical protein